MSADQQAALERLLAIALQGTGQSRRVADFLLAWWNARQCGGFDLTTMWGCDSAIVCRHDESVCLCRPQQPLPRHARLWRAIRSYRPSVAARAGGAIMSAENRGIVINIQHRRRIAGRHRDRAYECLRKAREARDRGNIAAARGYLDEARTWARFATACLHHVRVYNRELAS